ncbi:DNA polymerase subunit beta [Methylobacterium radiotolerans]|uniref:DNA polymerase subunit beta n=1 Tax=Methylobacterium TaxID=407 RepID=UPI001A0208B7|nr:DNA polymerase subunit beta [Parafilimonas terrae]
MRAPSFFPDLVREPHPVAAAATAGYLSAVDGMLPGFVAGFHVLGSAALDDFVPGRCDLDFVAVLSRRPDAGELDRLAELHGRMSSAGGPALDGIYVAGPDRIEPEAEGPSVREGRFEPRSRHRRRPVDRLALAEHALTLRGQAPPWRDVPELDGWALAAFDVLRESAGSMEVDEAVLGACRLHYLLAVRRIPSKSEAGLYGLIAFEERWRRIVDEALRMRREPRAPTLYADRDERRRDALAFVGVAAEDGLSLA